MSILLAKCITMSAFRRIKQVYSLTGGSLEWTNHTVLLDAYKECIPTDEKHCCRKTYYGVTCNIDAGETLIRVTCNHGDVYWIQLIDTKDQPLPLFSEGCPKIDCCHAH